MLFNKVPMINGMRVDEAHKKGGNSQSPVPQVAPTPAVEEASVDIEDKDNGKARTGKEVLKLPLAIGNTNETGLKV